MLTLLWLIPACPVAGFLSLMLFGYRLPRTAIAVIGAGTVALSALLAVTIAIDFMSMPPTGYTYGQSLWTWMHVGDFVATFRLSLDPLSLVMVLVITVVGFLIHLYSTRYMADDEGYHRFFAYMNLFVAAMLILVLASDLLVLYLGWEGVGLCSYLLIGFWYKDLSNGRAAMKAFIVTRIGDTALAIGLFILFSSFGTLQIHDIATRAIAMWMPGTMLPTVVAILLLIGAVGKSAQLPLHVWLPDAMAGPTPVSALIHAATMVTAGVYLIARTHLLFTLAPMVQLVVAVIGALTLLVAGFSALTQWDLKRVLAYSTISQLGYMFLALGIGAWAAAILHFVTHACFKSLLFLGAGVVTMSVHHETSMTKMGGLRKVLPLTFWTFLVGAFSMSALPLVTAGFYSKDLILYNAWAAQQGGPWLWAAGWAGALITALYAFRMVFYVFYGETRGKPVPVKSPALCIPLLVLAAFSLLVGFLELPRSLGDVHLFSRFLLPVLPEPNLAHGGFSTLLSIQLASEAASLGGVLLAYWLFLRNRDLIDRFVASPVINMFRKWMMAGWGFDWLYERLVVRPFVWVADINREDMVDKFYQGLGWMSLQVNSMVSHLQTGYIRWYVASLVIGAIILIAMLVLV